MSGFELPRLTAPLSGPQLEAPRLLGDTVAAPRDRTGAAEGPAFGGLLEQALQRVASLQDDVRTKTTELAMGRPVELHDLMLSMGKSEAAFNLMLEVRNKLVDAWEKISRSVV
jgi:flagellar hook-basal body complex protein FliE